MERRKFLRNVGAGVGLSGMASQSVSAEEIVTDYYINIWWDDSINKPYKLEDEWIDPIEDVWDDIWHLVDERMLDQQVRHNTWLPNRAGINNGFLSLGDSGGIYQRMEYGLPDSEVKPNKMNLLLTDSDKAQQAGEHNNKLYDSDSLDSSSSWVFGYVDISNPAFSSLLGTRNRRFILAHEIGHAMGASHYHADLNYDPDGGNLGASAEPSIMGWSYADAGAHYLDSKRSKPYTACDRTYDWKTVSSDDANPQSYFSSCAVGEMKQQLSVATGSSPSEYHCDNF